MGKPYGVEIKWHTIACFEIRFDGTTILTDPCIGDSDGTAGTAADVEGCDYIAVTHIHWDHITDLPYLCEKFSPRVFVGDLSAMPLLSWLDYDPSLVYPMPASLALDLGAFRLKAMYGRHVDPGKTMGGLGAAFVKNPLLVRDKKLRDIQLMGSLEYRNYLFTLKNGTKILLWGNDPTPEQIALCAAEEPDIAILQCSRQDKAALGELAAACGAKIVIPHHLDLHKTEAEYMPRTKQF